MGSNNTTGHKNYRPPGPKDIDTGEDYQDHALSFIKNTCLRFLQLVYAQKEKGCFHYDHGDESLTEIKIADQHAFQLEASDTRPAIIAVRGNLAWQNLGMNQGMQNSNIRSSETNYTDIIHGTVGFSCLSRAGLEAEALAADVFNLFKFFRRTLNKAGFFTIRSMSVGPEQLVEAPGEAKLFLVSVLVQCQLQDRWLLEPEAAAKLKRVVLEGLTNVGGECETVFRNEMTQEE